MLCSQEFTSDMNSRPVKRIEDVMMLRTSQFTEDAGPMAHPIRPDSYIKMVSDQWCSLMRPFLPPLLFCMGI
jgi:aminopeptidase N